MRHLKKGRKFGRKKGQRKAFYKGLIANLILKERIETTLARAKEIKPKIEKMITLAKKQDLAHQRLLISRLPKKAALKLYYEIAPRYKERNGGCVRITGSSKTRSRDQAEMSIIEFV